MKYYEIIIKFKWVFILLILYINLWEVNILFVWIKFYLGLKVICEILIYMIVFFYENYVYVYYVKFVVIVRV